MNSEKDVVFTKHALRRARERHLWKYVSKAKFFFDAIHAGMGLAQLDECLYGFCYNQEKNKVFIKTMMRAYGS